MMKISRNRLLYLIYCWTTTILWMIFIFWLSDQPDLYIVEGNLDKILRKLAHITVFAILFLMIFRTLLVMYKSRIKRLAFWRSRGEKAEDLEFVEIVEINLLVISMLLTIVYAVSDEFHQSYVPGRYASPYDVMWDSLGVVIAALAVGFWPVLNEVEVMVVDWVRKRISNF